METWEWITIAAVVGIVIYKAGQAPPIPPYQGYGANGPMQVGQAPGDGAFRGVAGSIENAAENPSGQNIATAVDSVASTVAGFIPATYAPTTGGNNKIADSNGAGGMVTAYDDAAGHAALEALNANAPLGVVQSKPEQPESRVTRVSAWGGGLGGRQPPKAPDPPNPAYSSRAYTSVSAVRGLSARPGLVGR